MGRSCRFCGAPANLTFADLGMSPLSNAYLEPGQLGRMERFYPLHARVCESCMLVQLEAFEPPEKIFSDYAYFSSYSESWIRHASGYVRAMTQRFGFDDSDLVIEIGSNDGYLLQFFVGNGVRVLGIEPAANVAAEAEKKGVPTMNRFFGADVANELAAAGRKADLIVGNNVLAHVPELNDFVKGIAILLKPDGVATLEFPHLLRLIRDNQFDTIYHEHFSYFSFIVAEKVFAAHGLTMFDVEEVPTHGGSLRVFVRHDANDALPVGPSVVELRAREQAAGLDRPAIYGAFAERIKTTKREFLKFLLAAQEAGRTVVGYGAPAKGNTLLNYCGVRSDLVAYTVDRSPHKQGRVLPGVHIPIHAPERVFETRPAYVLILPWNLQEEIMGQMAGIRNWGGRFVVPIPELRILE